MDKNYYMGLLERRAKRLNELLEIAAPQDILFKEIKLINETAALIRTGTQNEEISETRYVATG